MKELFRRPISLLVAFVALAAGCSTTHSGFRKPDMSKVHVGMTKGEVVASLGAPDNVATKGRLEFLEYGWDKFMDGVVGAAEWYYVRLIDGQVESFGRKGDFDSTKNPTVDVNLNQKITTVGGASAGGDSPIASDLFTRLKKLQTLKDDGLLTEDEFQKLRRKAIEEAK